MRRLIGAQPLIVLTLSSGVKRRVVRRGFAALGCRAPRAPREPGATPIVICNLSILITLLTAFATVLSPVKSLTAHH